MQSDLAQLTTAHKQRRRVLDNQAKLSDAQLFLSNPVDLSDLYTERFIRVNRLFKARQETLSGEELERWSKLHQEVKILMADENRAAVAHDGSMEDRWVKCSAMKLSAVQLKKRLRYLKEHDNYPDHSGEYDDIFLKSDQCVESSLAPHEFTRRTLLLARGGAVLPMGNDWKSTDGKNDFQLVLTPEDDCTGTQKRRRRLLMGLPEFRSGDDKKNAMQSWTNMTLSEYLQNHHVWTSSDDKKIGDKTRKELTLAQTTNGMTFAQIEARRKGRALASDAKYKKGKNKTAVPQNPEEMQRG